MLGQPIAQGPDEAGGYAPSVGEEGGMEDDKDGVEDGSTDGPAPPIPPQAEGYGRDYDGKEDRAGADDARLAVVQGVEAQQLDGEGSEEGKDQDGHHHRQVEGGRAPEAAAIGQPAGKGQQGEEGAEDEPVDEGHLLGAKGQREESRCQIKIDILALLQILKAGEEEQHGPDSDVDIVADIAGVIEERGRDEEQGRGYQGPRPPQPLSQEVGEAHQSHAEEGRHDAGREVVHPKKEVDERVGVEEEGAVHHGVVLIALADIELPGIVGMQALVVAHGAHAQVPEAGEHGGGDE